MIDDELELLGDGVLIHGHRDASERLRRAHRTIESRPVAPDDRELVATFESECREAASQPIDLGLERAPRPGLPDAVLLFPRRVPIRKPVRVEREELRKRIDIGR